MMGVYVAFRWLWFRVSMALKGLALDPGEPFFAQTSSGETADVATLSKMFPGCRTHLASPPHRPPMATVIVSDDQFFDAVQRVAEMQGERALGDVWVVAAHTDAVLRNVTDEEHSVLGVV